jgi:hypothetical protein
MKLFGGINANMLRVSEQTSEVGCSMYGNRTATVEDLVSPNLLFELQKKCLVILFDNRFPRGYLTTTSLKVRHITVFITRNNTRAYYFGYGFLQKCSSVLFPCTHMNRK